MRRTIARSLVIAAALLLGQTLAAQAAYEFYVTIEGTKQGKLRGESTREAHKQALPGIAFSYEVKSPRDAATGLPSGKRQHGPVTFTKTWGPATPQIFTALVTNELLKSVLFEFVRTNRNGEEYVYQTIKLTNATVSSLKWHTPEVPEGKSGEAQELEEVALTFQKIEVENKDGKTLGMDDWTK